MADNGSERRHPTDWWERSDVEIEQCSGLTVAHLPATDDAWISGWVEVPR